MASKKIDWPTLVLLSGLGILLWKQQMKKLGSEIGLGMTPQTKEPT